VSTGLTCECGATENVTVCEGLGAVCDSCFGPALEELRADAAHGLRTRGVIWDRVRPVRWLWRKRIPSGLLSLIVGVEDIGKGTLASWIIANATRGELDGDFQGEPINVLIVGDEDLFEPIWVPRLHAAGTDLERIRTLDDGEHLEDFRTRADDLSRAVEREEIGYIVFDQVLDHIAGGENGSGIYNPKNIRAALAPLRRVAGEHGIATTGLLHPVKGSPKTFRDLIAGSHQINAVSRSSLLLGKHPRDPERRVLVRGKGNHSAAPRSFEFRIGIASVALNGHRFEMPFVADSVEGEFTIDDLLEIKPVVSELKEKLADLLTDEPQRLTDLAKAVGRDPKDGSVRNALKELAKERRARQVEGGWCR
jgi:hypothetical protein